MKDTSLQRAVRACTAPSSTCRCSPATASRRTSARRRSSDAEHRDAYKQGPATTSCASSRTTPIARLRDAAASARSPTAGRSELAKGSARSPRRLPRRARDVDQWFDIRLADDEVNDAARGSCRAQLDEQRKDFERRFEEKRSKLTRGDELPPGVHEDGQGLRRREAQALSRATRWPAATATRAWSRRSCRSRTCRSWRTARRSTSC
ncbi:MAG: hypothetical protein MZW92_51390 [Comamonadaceae bacterium]|nr:hypothetical protein [Comamonadaceae bacterium]